VNPRIRKLPKPPEEVSYLVVKAEKILERENASAERGVVRRQGALTSAGDCGKKRASPSKERKKYRGGSSYIVHAAPGKVRKGEEEEVGWGGEGAIRRGETTFLRVHPRRVKV